MLTFTVNWYSNTNSSSFPIPCNCHSLAFRDYNGDTDADVQYHVIRAQRCPNASPSERSAHRSLPESSAAPFRYWYKLSLN